MEGYPCLRPFSAQMRGHFHEIVPYFRGLDLFNSKDPMKKERILRELRTVAFLMLGIVASSGLFAQGDNCAAAVSVTPGTYTADGPATGAGASGVCNTTGATNADWYVFTAPGPGTIDVFSCLGGADTRLSIYDGSCATLNCISTNDDACPTTTGGANFASEILGTPVTAGTDYYIEWDDRWTTSGFDWVLNYNCGNAPVGTDAIILDCVNSTWTIDVTVASLGSATAVDILNDAGAAALSGVGLGTYSIGPFPFGVQVQYQIVNLQDPGCDFFSAFLNDPPCPIISCGPDNYNYCYGANLDTLEVYQAAGAFPLALSFNSGDVSFGDDITIYDGAGVNAPVLFTGTNGGDMTGVVVVSQNSGNYLTYQHTSNGTSDCQASAGLFSPIDFDVFCLTCTNPNATYTVVPNCINQEWFLEVTIDSTGNGGAVDIVNDFDTDTIFGVTGGSVQLGPYPLGLSVSASLLNVTEYLCRQNGPPLVWTEDSCTIVSCGVDSYQYCYENNDDAWFTFQRDTLNFGPGPITVRFLSGDMIDFDDRVIIYNGPNEQSSNITNSNFGGSLSGQSFNSTNPDGFLTVRFVSDASGSCDDGSASAPIEFEVGCGAVGIEEQSITDITLFPNPANNVLNLVASGDLNNASISIYDMLGTLVSIENVSAAKGTTIELNTSKLSTGNYLLQTVTDGFVKAQRFQISR